MCVCVCCDKFIVHNISVHSVSAIGDHYKSFCGSVTIAMWYIQIVLHYSSGQGLPSHSIPLWWLGTGACMVLYDSLSRHDHS